MAEVNTRAHRVTRRPPVVMLAEEHEHLHRLPRLPHTVCFGQTRKVNWQSMISVGGAQYSVPHELIDERVWARIDGSELVVVHVDGHHGPTEVARHQLTTPGRPAIYDEHYPPRPAGALERKPRARSAEERAFLALGEGAERWLIKAAAQGAQRVRRKMAEAVDLAKLHGTAEVERALRTCADAGRFADGDLAAILAHQQAAGELILFPAAPRSARCSAPPAAGRDSDDEHPESRRSERNRRAERRSAALRAPRRDRSLTPKPAPRPVRR